MKKFFIMLKEKKIKSNCICPTTVHILKIQHAGFQGIATPLLLLPFKEWNVMPLSWSVSSTQWLASHEHNVVKVVECNAKSNCGVHVEFSPHTFCLSSLTLEEAMPKGCPAEIEGSCSVGTLRQPTERPTWWDRGQPTATCMSSEADPSPIWALKRSQPRPTAWRWHRERGRPNPTPCPH